MLAKSSGHDLLKYYLIPSLETIQLEQRAIVTSRAQTTKGKPKISTAGIAGIIVFTVLFIAFILMFLFYRKSRKAKDKEKDVKHTSRANSHVVKLSPLSVQTSTVKLACQPSPTPIRAAPDYESQGMGRRLSRRPDESTSSEDEQYYDAADDTTRKYDWSGTSPKSTTKKKAKKAEIGPTNKSMIHVDSDTDDVDGGLMEDEVKIDYPSGHIGRIWLQIDYESVTEKLNVTVFKIRNLPSRDDTLTPPDVMVRLYLLPDERCQHQSEVKLRTRNPNFIETFHFQVARDHLRQRVLRLSVYDQGKGHRGDVIGHVLYPLKDQGFGVEIWRDIETLSEVGSTLGDLHVSIVFYPVLDRLTVIVLRAKNLPKKKGKWNPDTYVKVTFSKGNNIMKVKKTGVKYDTIEPFYNESFNITSTSDDLPSCSLLLSVYQNNDNSEEDGRLIGRVILGGMMYARGKELEHWTEMICQPRVMVKYWHPLSK